MDAVYPSGPTIVMLFALLIDGAAPPIPVTFSVAGLRPHCGGHSVLDLMVISALLLTIPVRVVVTFPLYNLQLIVGLFVPTISAHQTAGVLKCVG